MNTNHSEYTYPIPSDVELVNRVSQWPAKENPNSAFPYSAEVSFEFPLPSQTLLFLSQGALSAGDLRITTSSTVRPDFARVRITVSCHDEGVRDVAKVGLIKRKGGESGVGIFTPKYWVGQTWDRLYFNVKLALPQNTPSYLNNLTTDMSNFSHNVGPFKDIVNFGEISLTGSQGKIIVKDLGAQKVTFSTSNAPVEVDNLVALNAVVHSSNGPISGTYHVFDSLDLRTTNASIKVAVGLTGDSNINASQTLTMRTSNDVLESAINLTASPGTKGNFRIKAGNSNGHLSTWIGSCPVGAVLSLDASTSNGSARVMLPTAYEGGFTLSTSNAMAEVRRLTPNEHDPAGRGRQRVLEMKTATKGVVYWDKINLGRGNVTLKSSNGPVSIYV